MRLIIKRLLSLFPTKLPVGMTEFHKFANEVIELSGKYADDDSMKFAIASQVMHLGAQTSSAPKNYFVRSLRKAAANQVASQVFQDVKIKQQEAAKQAAAAEETAKISKVAVISDQAETQKEVQ
jgi:hypothetical protein